MATVSDLVSFWLRNFDLEILRCLLEQFQEWRMVRQSEHFQTFLSAKTSCWFAETVIRRRMSIRYYLIVRSIYYRQDCTPIESVRSVNVETRKFAPPVWNYMVSVFITILDLRLFPFFRPNKFVGYKSVNWETWKCLSQTFESRNWA